MPANKRTFWKVRATLARDGDAMARHAVQRERRAVAMGQRDAAVGRPVEAGDAVEHGGLAGAVRADDGGDVAGARLERQVVDRLQAAEAHGQVGDRQHQPRPCATSSAEISFGFVSAIVGVRPDTRPRGRSTIITTSARPKISMRYSGNSLAMPAKNGLPI